MTNRVFAAGSGLAIAIASACSPIAKEGTGTASMSTSSAMKVAPPVWAEVSPIFASNCAGCHSGGSPSGALRLDTYTGVKKGGSSGAAIKPGDAKNSLLVKRIHGTIKPQMPLGGDPLPAPQRTKIESWIEGGALLAAPGVAPPKEKPVETPKLPKAGEPVLYKHVQTIFAQRCVMCHVDGGQMGRAPEGFRLDSYANALRSGERANIIPGNPEASQLIRFVKGRERPRMPFNKPPLSQEEIRILSDWIRQGARDNDGARGPIPVGREVRFEGTLERRWVVDGIGIDASGARIDKSPRPGDVVEVRGAVTSNGGVRATRIRRR